MRKRKVCAIYRIPQSRSGCSDRGRELEDVQFDEEGGEGDALAVERERIWHGHTQLRDETDQALERLKAGTYGICLVSGKSIPKERLRAIPWAAERVEFKTGGFLRR